MWQHCAKASRSALGVKPCPRIRQAARPILTRKLCHHCGGPRYFARRGGLAARGSGRAPLVEVEQESDACTESSPTSYQSDVIHEESEYGEDNDSSLSPRASGIAMKKWKEVPRQHSMGIHRSASSRSNWTPNLKRELSAASHHRRRSIDSTLTMSSESSDRSSRPRWLSRQLALLEPSSVPTLQQPQPRRKSSTLLHPSPPLETPPEFDSWSNTADELTPPSTPHQRSELRRLRSTLLHPSSPGSKPTTSLEETESLDAALTQLTTVCSLQVPIPTAAPRRHGPSPNSTLLHPSAPLEAAEPEPTGTDFSSTFLKIMPTIVSKSPVISSMPPTPPHSSESTPTPTQSPFDHLASIMHSTSSDDAWWDEPLRSCQSDVGYESDGTFSEANIEYHHEDLVVASSVRTGRMARASRISFHGNQLRILQL